MFLSANTVFGENFRKIGPYCGRKGPKNPKRVSWMVIPQTFEKLYLDNHKCYTDETYYNHVSL